MIFYEFTSFFIPSVSNSVLNYINRKIEFFQIFESMVDSLRINFPAHVRRFHFFIINLGNSIPPAEPESDSFVPINLQADEILAGTNHIYDPVFFYVIQQLNKQNV